MDAERIRVVVAMLTYRRPDLLDESLAALANLTMPESADVSFLIVDNDPDASARALVEERAARFPVALDYVVEPEPGIPAARNRALDEAITRGANLLCFTDDDVQPRVDWLDSLVRCARSTGAAMTFGAVRFMPWSDTTSRWQRAIAAGIGARATVLERYAARYAARGQVVVGATSNCAIDADWAASYGIRFDTAMRESGGSDTAFREAVRRSGGTLVWSADAIVDEQLPAERLSLRYQFRRAVAHGATTALVGRPVPQPMLRSPYARIVSGTALMIAPVLGRGSFMAGLHLVGMGVGMLRARRGRRARLYVR